MVLVHPVWWVILYEKTCRNTITSLFLALVYIGGGVFSYTASALLHCGTYDAITENLLLMVDNFGIFLMIGCNFTPVALLSLPQTGLLMICLMWTAILVSATRIFYWKRTLWWEPILVGSLALLSLKEMCHDDSRLLVDHGLVRCLDHRWYDICSPIS